MIVIRLNGGLGNQMFQYAFGRSLALMRNETLGLDLSNYEKNINPDTPRKFELGNFMIMAEILPINERNNSSSLWLRLSQKINLFFRGDYHMRFHPALLKKKQHIFDGFFQSYKYFIDYEKIIRNDFSLNFMLTGKAKELAESIILEKSVSVHIRRGDYVTNEKNYQGYGVCSIEYYKEAIKIVSTKQPKAEFYVFSDDIKWVKENLSFPDLTVYVSGYGFDDSVEMYLMSLCKYNIIANSTFSWWAAWLNKYPNKIVIAPKKWANISVVTNDLLPVDWLKI